MSIRDPSLQYMVREHLAEEDSNSELRLRGHGSIATTQMLCLRWNSGTGGVFVDGAHMQHPLELGDEIKIDGHAPVLKIFDKVPTE
jgi:RNase P/RNase MRP subunit p29